MERMVIEFLANAFWQLPLLAMGAWLLLRIIRPEPVVQHRVWLAVLGLALVLPLRGAIDRPAKIERIAAGAVAVQQAVRPSLDAFSADAFDAVGQPGGLVLGHQTSGAWPNFSSLAFASRMREVQLNATAVHWIVGLYLAVLLGGIVRFARACHGARHLATESREIVLTDREQAALTECARRIGIKVPRVRELRASESPGIAGPVVVGATKPVLLWEGDFAGELFAREREDELMAALCHEMAHIRRRDYLMNLLCATAALPLKWHPATYAIEGRIRTTREMVCDAMAAKAMGSDTKYANCLLSLAQNMVAAGGVAEQAVGAAALGLFGNDVLEERMMRLMQAKTEISMRARAIRSVAGGAAMMAAVTLAAAFHVVPAMAQSQAMSAGSSTMQSAKAAAPAKKAVASDAQAKVVEGGDASHAGAIKVAPVVKVNPVVHVSPVVHVEPIVNIASVSPVVHVESVVHVAPVVRVSPVAHLAPATPMLQTAPSAPAAPSTPDATPVPPPPAPPPPGAQKAPPVPAAPAPPTANRSRCEDDDYAIVDGVRRKLTPEEKRRLEEQLVKARAQIAAATAKLNSPEFRQQIEKAQQDAMEAVKQINSAEFQKQMADAQKQIAEASAKLNSPEFRQQIEKAQRDAMEAEKQINSAEFQKQMADAQKQIADALARMKAEQEAQQEKGESK